MTRFRRIRRMTVLAVAAVAVPLTAGSAVAGPAGPAGAPQNAPSVVPLGGSAGAPANAPSVLPPAGGQQVPVVSGLTVIDRTSFATVTAGASGQVTAVCRAGEERISGGFALTGDAYRGDLPPSAPYDRYPVFADYPSGTAGWTVGVINRTGGSTFLVAHVECTPGTVGVQIGQTAPDPSDSGTATALCPAGSVVTGGGWAVRNIHRSNQVVSVWASTSVRSQTQEGWRIRSSVPSGSRADAQQNAVVSYAVCARSWLHASQGTTSTILVPAGGTVPTTGQGRAGCSGPDSLTGAGFTLPRTDASVVITAFYPDYSLAAPAWALTAYGLPSSTGVSGGQVSLVPVCDHGSPF